MKDISFISAGNDIFEFSDSESEPLLSDNGDKAMSLYNEKMNCDPNIYGFTSQNLENEPSIQFSGKLYQSPDISRKRVNDIITDVSELYEKTLISVRSEVRSHLKNVGMNDANLSEIETIFEKFSQPFGQTKTKKQRLAQFQYYDSFIPPHSYRIGEKTEYECKHTGSKRKEVCLIRT